MSCRKHRRCAISVGEARAARDCGSDFDHRIRRTGDDDDDEYDKHSRQGGAGHRRCLERPNGGELHVLQSQIQVPKSADLPPALGVRSSDAVRALRLPLQLHAHTAAARAYSLHVESARKMAHRRSSAKWNNGDGNGDGDSD